MPHIFVFYGRSGSGKGTQAELLKKYLEKKDPENPVLYFSTGAYLRSFSKEGTHTSLLIEKTLAKGGLLPPFVPIWAWSKHFIDRFTGGEHVILDGVARRLPEPAVLNSAFEYYGFEKAHVVLLNVSREWATMRLKARARYDDTDRDIKERLDWYEENTMPAVEFFKNETECAFYDINGEQDIEKVHQEIIAKILEPNKLN